MKPKYRFFANWGYALAGLAAMWRAEKAFRLELAFCLPALVVSVFLPVSLALHLLLAGAVVAVLVAECINSAIEAAVDLAQPAPHPLAKIAKDCASAAVFLTICAAVGAWVAAVWRLV